MECFWLTVTRSAEPTPLNLGIGVTATSEADAQALVYERYGDQVVVKAVTLVTDMRQIDQHHVVPNMGNHLVRGIWWPRQT